MWKGSKDHWIKKQIRDHPLKWYIILWSEIWLNLEDYLIIKLLHKKVKFSKSIYNIIGDATLSKVNMDKVSVDLFNFYDSKNFFIHLFAL